MNLWVWAGWKCCLDVSCDNWGCIDEWEVTVCWLTICVSRATFFFADDNVAWWVWYVLLRNMPYGSEWHTVRCINVVEGVVVFNVLYTTVMGWHAVMTTFCICGWTTVVLSVLIHHGAGVVWSWYEWSWLLYLVQYCSQTISWLLSVWIVMEMVCVWCVPPWWWYVFDDVCRHGGGMRRRRGRMDECLLLRPLNSW